MGEFLGNTPHDVLFETPPDRNDPNAPDCSQTLILRLNPNRVRLKSRVKLPQGPVRPPAEAIPTITKTRL